MPTGSEDSYDEPLPFLQGLLHGEGQGPPSQMPPPEVLGKYEVVGQLTQGTTTGVYLARDPHLDRRVSLRVIPLPTGCPESLERQQRDIRQATKLVHRNIVQLYDVETLTLPLTGQLVDCMVLEFIEGQTLEPQLPQLELTDRIRILEDVAHAIGHAHRQGIIHGCLRPASVLIATDRRTVVTDFGLFSFCGEGQSIPTNPTMDKLPFSSPEQLGGANNRPGALSVPVVVTC